MLRILRDIINNTNDISLIEATAATWHVFCQHQDVANLAADSEYRTLYEEVVRLYGSLAKNHSHKLGKSTQPVAHHDAIRLRKTGAEAVKSIFGMSELNRNWNREYHAAIAAVLTNLRCDSEHKDGTNEYLQHLVAMSTKNEEEDRPSTVNRRQSIATVRTFSGLPDEQDPDPRTAEGTAQDADRLEEEEVGFLALECIRAIFQSQNRAQIRDGAVAFMRYVADEAERCSAADAVSGLQLWAATLFQLITSWTPVQVSQLELMDHNFELTAAGPVHPFVHGKRNSHQAPTGEIARLPCGIIIRKVHLRRATLGHESDRSVGDRHASRPHQPDNTLGSSCCASPSSCASSATSGRPRADEYNNFTNRRCK